jgi:hypothetical protein
MIPATPGLLQPDGERRVRTSRNPYLLLLALCCSVVCFAYAVILTPYVMPNYYDKHLPFSERLKSTSFGDSGAYGSYADGFLRQRAFQNSDGQPVIKHMPGLPLILAVFIALFGTVDAFRAAEILFFFVTLYCFLILLKHKVPVLVLAATILVMALHPLMAQLFLGLPGKGHQEVSKTGWCDGLHVRASALTMGCSELRSNRKGHSPDDQRHQSHLHFVVPSHDGVLPAAHR